MILFVEKIPSNDINISNIDQIISWKFIFVKKISYKSQIDYLLKKQAKILNYLKNLKNLFINTKYFIF